MGEWQRRLHGLRVSCACLQYRHTECMVHGEPWMGSPGDVCAEHSVVVTRECVEPPPRSTHSSKPLTWHIIWPLVIMVVKGPLGNDLVQSVLKVQNAVISRLATSRASIQHGLQQQHGESTYVQVHADIWASVLVYRQGGTGVKDCMIKKHG